MTITIKIDCDNAAFEAGAEYEVARILTELAAKLNNKGFWDGYALKDHNGNTVGRMDVAE